MMTLDHVSPSVSGIARSRAFHAAALAPLGISVLMEGGAVHVAFVAACRANAEAVCHLAED